MASNLNLREVTLRIIKRRAALDKETEEKIQFYMDDMDKNIGDAINNATRFPVHYTYPKALETDVLHTAWWRLADKLRTLFGYDRCKFDTIKKTTTRYNGKDDWIETKEYGVFTLTEGQESQFQEPSPPS